MSGTGVTGRWETITGSIEREERENGLWYVIRLAGKNLDGLWVGLRTDIAADRPASSFTRALDLAVRALAIKGVR